MAVAQNRYKPGGHIVQELISFRRGQRIAEAIGERGEPPAHPCWKGSRTGNQRNVVHKKPGTFKLLAILIG